MYKYYRILNLAPGADMGQVKKAFRMSAQRYHPDVNGGVGNPEKFKDAVKAYRYLQKHYEVLNAKHLAEEKSARDALCRNFAGIFGGLPVSGARVRNAARSAGSKAPAYSRAPLIDPNLLDLSFEELEIRLAKPNNDFVKKQSARALTYLFGERALGPLKRELEFASLLLCEEILLCLGVIGNRESIKTIARFLRHPNVKIACTAVNVLRHVNNSYAKRLLENMEREGRALGTALAQIFDTMRSRRFVRAGALGLSEFYIARALRKNRREPLPIILRELGRTA